MNTPPLAVDKTSIEAHYDLSDEFFQSFLDPSMIYSCAYFETGNEDLHQAQIAKVDLSFRKLDLHPGERLLDIGSGWGAVALRAYTCYDVSVVGLTLSTNQWKYATNLATSMPKVRFQLEGWETYDEPCDKIITIGAFEHFTRVKYAAFFQKCRNLLPIGGLMLLHTITTGKPNIGFGFLRFRHFIGTKIFPNSGAPDPEDVIREARLLEFELLHAESLRHHYARTLDHWAANLQANRAAAVRAKNEEVYELYMEYLTRSAAYFRSGEVNVYQFLLRRG